MTDLTSTSTWFAPIGVMGLLGSGHALGGVSIGMALAIVLLLLVLVPPPFWASRLQPAAVIWRPQRFVGPLVPPG